MMSSRLRPLAPSVVRESLRSSQREAVPWAIMQGLTESFMIPYALALGGTAFQAGLLSSVRNFILSLVQLKSAEAAHWVRSRKMLVLWTSWMQAALWVPIAFVSLLFGPWAVLALIGLYTVGTASAAFGSPAWGSLVTESLAPDERGRFFAHRSRVVGGWVTVAGLASGGLLQLYAAQPLIGFGLLCAAAAVSRAISCHWLARLAEGPWQEPVEAKFSFWEFIRQLPRSNFAKFSVCIGLLSFAANLSAPYLAVYMLEELGYGYFTYSVIVLTGSVMAFLTVTRWGRVADRFGNWVVLRWTMLGVSLLPVLWTWSSHPLWLFVLHLLGGFLWGGLNLCMVNFVYDAATPAKRARCLAYFNVINGCSVSLGALTGGWLVAWLPPLNGSVFISLFCCSAVLRLGMALLFPRVVQEVRQVRQVGLREVAYDLVGQRVIHVLGFLSVKPELEGNHAVTSGPN